MKTNNIVRRTALFCVIGLLGMPSCADEDRLSLEDSQDVTEEALTDAYFQDIDDMAAVVIQSPSEDVFSGGKIAEQITVDDDRFDCDGIVVTLERAADSSGKNPRGKITVDFGEEGCEVRGNVRRGTMIFTYSGRRFMPGSKVVITGEGYSINGVRLEGTRTITNVTESTADAPKFNVKLEGGKITFEDESFATRESDITSTWVRGDNPLNDKLIIDVASTASGTTRRGRSYEVSLLEPLEFRRFCGLPVRGVKRYVVNKEKEIVIDYGEGECDRSVTVTVNGVTHNVNVD